MWIGLREEIAETFSALQVPQVPTEDLDASGYSVPKRWSGFHTHKHLNVMKATTKEKQTEEDRRKKRRVLEQNRRAYKTAKQREYDARKRAA